MICHEFKGGIGTSSRVVEAVGGHVVGVLVQANYGRRDALPGGRGAGGRGDPGRVRRAHPGVPGASPGGSIIVIVGTDAPLLPGQCERLAQRAGLGIARVGGGRRELERRPLPLLRHGEPGLPVGGHGPKTR